MNGQMKGRRYPFRRGIGVLLDELDEEEEGWYTLLGLSEDEGE